MNALAAFCPRAHRLVLRCRVSMRRPAQQYPSRPVKLIVPYPAGGTADAMARIVADSLSRKWDQPVVVENRAGASGNLAAEFVGRAEPDGYTLLSTPQSPLVINQHLAKLKFDPAEFTPVILISRVPNAVIVGPSVRPAT